MEQTIFQQLAELFPRTIHTIMKDFKSKTSEELGLNQTQIHTMIKLQKFKTSTMGDLCRRIGLTKGSMTTVIDNLLEQGYVIRERSDADRRKVLVRLTDKGSAIASACKIEAEQLFGTQLSRLTDEEQSAFKTSIATIRTILDKMERLEDE